MEICPEQAESLGKASSQIQPQAHPDACAGAKISHFVEETLGSQRNGIHLLVYLSQSKGLYSKATTLKTRRGLQNRPKDKSTRCLGKAASGAPSFLDQPRQKGGALTCTSPRVSAGLGTFLGSYSVPHRLWAVRKEDTMKQRQRQGFRASPKICSLSLPPRRPPSLPPENQSYSPSI